MRKYHYFWVSVKWTIEQQLQNFIEYNSVIERTLDEQLRNFETRFQSELESLPSEQHEEVAEWYYDDACNLIENFPQLSRRNIFIALYSFLEQQLLSICRYYEKQRINGIQLDDLQHEGIIQAQVYLEKVVGIVFPSTDNSWQDILKYNKLRNCLVHIGPRLSHTSKFQKIKTTIEQIKHVNVESNGEIKLELAFFENVLKKIEAFFHILIKDQPKS